MTIWYDSHASALYNRLSIPLGCPLVSVLCAADSCISVTQPSYLWQQECQAMVAVKSIKIVSKCRQWDFLLLHCC